MKADIKFCASSFSVITLPVFYIWSKLSSGRMRAAFTEFRPVLLQLKRRFTWSRKRISFCDWQSWNPTPMFGIPEPNYTDLQVCDALETSVWKRQKMYCDSKGRHVVQCPRRMLNGYAKHFRGAHRGQLFITFCAKDWNCMPTSISSFVEEMPQPDSFLVFGAFGLK
jgi:hypothetical protein